MNKARIYENEGAQQAAMTLTAPFIYGMIIPIALLHLCTKIYQSICFPIYGIELVDSSKYVKDKRFGLPYLNWFQKINCLYCSYGNGVLAFAIEVSKQTEQVWCPIKNKDSVEEFDLPHRENFAEYDDVDSFIQHQKDNHTLL